MRVKPQIIGILNVTPDSFFDGGAYLSLQKAIEHGHQLLKEGADVLDIGGESTRPGAQSVSIEEECARVIGVIQALHSHATISIDTSKPKVARAALEAGATILNDVQGLQNPEMMEISQDFDEVVIMHSRGTPQNMTSLTQYEDVVDNLIHFFATQITRCPCKKIWVDPGIGFAKNAEQSCTILRSLPRFHSLGHPLYIGASRKSFIKHALALAPEEDRLAGSLAAIAVGYQHGVAAFRVHDVAQTKQFLDMLMVLDPLS